MKVALRLLSYLGYLLARLYLFPFYFLSGFSSRRPDLWVFGSWGGHRFADNSAAFFLYCQQRVGNGIRLVWISRDADIVASLREGGYEAYRAWSLRGLSCCLRAKLYVFDSFSKDINFWPSRGARKVNLWSGVPLKTFERDIRTPGGRYYRLFHGSLPERLLLGMMMPWHLDRPDLIIATAEETKEITRRAFDVPAESVVVTGFPRNDVLFSAGEAEAALKAHWPTSFTDAVDSQRKIIMYLPTYRDSGKPFFNVDWNDLDRLVAQLGATFFFKFHPDDKGVFEGDLNNVIELPQGIDIYTMLAHTDILISDYSSIIFDFMLLDRPIIYYLPDLDEFVSSSRSLNFDPLEIAVGPVCRTGEELLRTVADTVAAAPEPAEHRALWSSTRERFNTYTDGGSCARVMDAIERQLLSDGPMLDRMIEETERH